MERVLIAQEAHVLEHALIALGRQRHRLDRGRVSRGVLVGVVGDGEVHRLKAGGLHEQGGAVAGAIGGLGRVRRGGIRAGVDVGVDGLAAVVVEGNRHHGGVGVRAVQRDRHGAVDADQLAIRARFDQNVDARTASDRLGGGDGRLDRRVRAAPVGGDGEHRGQAGRRRQARRRVPVVGGQCADGPRLRQVAIDRVAGGRRVGQLRPLRVSRPHRGARRGAPPAPLPAAPPPPLPPAARARRAAARAAHRPPPAVPAAPPPVPPRPRRRRRPCPPRRRRYPPRRRRRCRPHRHPYLPRPLQCLRDRPSRRPIRHRAAAADRRPRRRPIRRPSHRSILRPAAARPRPPNRRRRSFLRYRWFHPCRPIRSSLPWRYHRRRRHHIPSQPEPERTTPPMKSICAWSPRCPQGVKSARESITKSFPHWPSRAGEAARRRPPATSRWPPRAHTSSSTSGSRVVGRMPPRRARRQFPGDDRGGLHRTVAGTAAEGPAHPESFLQGGLQVPFSLVAQARVST